MSRSKLNLILAVIAWVLACICVLAYNFVWLPNHSDVPEPEPEPVVEEAPVVTAIRTVEEEIHTSAIEFFPVPLDHDLQAFVIRTCEELSIDPAIIMAMIDRESSFRADCIGDSGDSVGLMQIQERHHRERMDRLGADDLFNPLQNIAVGIDYFVELHDKYDGNIEMALMAYNAGPSGAHKHWFSNGVYSNDYSKAVLATSVALKEGLRDADLQV